MCVSVCVHSCVSPLQKGGSERQQHLHPVHKTVGGIRERVKEGKGERVLQEAHFPVTSLCFLTSSSCNDAVTQHAGWEVYSVCIMRRRCFIAAHTLWPFCLFISDSHYPISLPGHERFTFMLAEQRTSYLSMDLTSLPQLFPEASEFTAHHP